MKMKQINETLKNLSKELTKLNEENNTDINIFYQDDGSFNSVIFHDIDMGNCHYKYFELYYKPSFYVNLSEESDLDYDMIVERIKEKDDTMTDRDIKNYFNNNYNVTDWVFETRIANESDYDEDFNTIITDNPIMATDEIINDIKTYLEI